MIIVNCAARLQLERKGRDDRGLSPFCKAERPRNEAGH